MKFYVCTFFVMALLAAIATGLLLCMKHKDKQGCKKSSK